MLGIEPVRDGRGWEQKDVETTSRADIVERLLAQASQHVDFQKVFLDRGFDSIEVRDVIDRHSSTYVLGKTKNANIDKKQIEEIKEDSAYDDGSNGDHLSMMGASMTSATSTIPSIGTGKRMRSSR